MKTENRNGVIAKLVSGLFAVALVITLGVSLSSCGDDPIVGKYTWGLDTRDPIALELKSDGTVSGTCKGNWKKVDDVIYELTGCDYRGDELGYVKIKDGKAMFSTDRDKINQVLDKY